MIDVRRARDRFHTAIDWLDSWHSFSFSSHYDPANVGHGLLLVSNDDRVAAGQGFGAHAHQDMEIVTWVLEGALAHQDSAGNSGVITPGVAQRMSAGTGIRHSEMNASRDEPVHFLQMWVRPDTVGVEPGYEQVDISDRLVPGELVPVASGRGHEGAVHLHQQDAVLWAVRLDEGQTVTIPAAPHVHVFVARGSARLSSASIDLAEGDAVRLTDEPEQELTAAADTEVLVWEV
ncbi:MAG TPA: pirin family protein [Acidimicrobiales bacterium]